MTWSALEDADVDAVIAAQIDAFAGIATGWEWKHYSHDQPPDLPDRLVRAGFVRRETEALLVADLAETTLDASPPADVQLRASSMRRASTRWCPCTRRCSAKTTRHSAEFCSTRCNAGPSPLAAVVAVAGDTPIAAGRVEFHAGTEFASLWGGGTVAAWRGRGVFRALVAHRAALAAERGSDISRSTRSRPAARSSSDLASSSSPRRRPSNSHHRPRSGPQAAIGCQRGRQLREGRGVLGHEALERSDFERRREQVALAAVAAELAEALQLGLVLDALGDRDEAEAAAELHERGDQRVVGVAGGDEGAVDLQRVDRELLQVGERGVAGAEVVDRDPDAEARSSRRIAAAASASRISAVSVISSDEQVGLEAGAVQRVVDGRAPGRDRRAGARRR